MYNFQITGDIACNLNASSCDSPTHSGPTLLILNDQGGSVMNVSEDVVATLRSQMKHHEPVVCFEPGIMSRDCSAGNRAYVDICSTLRAQMGDNQPAVCYGVDFRNSSLNREKTNTIQAKSNGGFSYNATPSVCYGRMHTLNTIEHHAVCYAIFKMKNDGNPHSGCHKTDVSSTLDLTGANPNCEQGGILIVCEGHSTLIDTTDVHGVCHGSQMMALMTIGNTNSNAAIIKDDTSPTLLGTRGEHGEVPIVMLGRNNE